ncbi:epidermal growth factor receptor substrate 15-like 1 [Acropora palmata]|uniref:epidermal growth factor receptor substrate 15-like 1 n=1 Tax=Acropora palmata TaxID=6131 RepID=UPI003DA03DF7
MSTNLPSITQLSAGHATVYENFFRQADVSNTGQIGASDAAAFLKKSGLKEGILHKIWELADPQGTGYLDKHRFFLALRLIALAQNGKEVSLTNLMLLVPAPKVGDILTPVVPPPQESTLWAVKAAEKAKYDNIFEGLKPVNGLLPGEKVRPVLLNSKLPIDVLGRVWELADIDKDGMLDSDEFAVAMHLVYRALEGDPVPLSLHGKVIPPSKRKLKLTSSAPSSPSPKGLTPPSVSSSSLSVTATTESPWVVSSADKLRYDAIFKQADKDGDGLVSGEEVKSTFMASGLPQQILAHIWGLCDVTNQGQLNSEQFALAMYLIHQKVMGVDPPQTLSPEMVPPSMRTSSAGTPVAAGEATEPSSTGNVISSLSDFSAIKELDKITKEIEDLGREKANLQHEIEEKEDTIRKRNAEIQNLQSELEKTKVKCQELENQKTEAQGKLDELDKEKGQYEEMLKDVRQKCDEETKTINNLKSQIASSRQSALQQEEELSQAREELNKLREEETKLEREIEFSKDHLDTVQKQLKSVQTELSQARSKVSTLEETNNSLNANIAHYNSLMNSNSISSGPSAIPDFAPLHDAFDMTPTPSEADAMSVRATAGSSPVSSISGFSVGSGRVDEAVDDFKDSDPFKSKDNLFGSSETESSDPFHVEDPFKTDPFHYKTVSFADPFPADPFEGDDLFKNDPFKSDLPASGETNGTASGISNGLSSSPSKSDPFSMDPFQSTFPSSKNSGDNFFSSDPFKPSGGSSDSNKKTGDKDSSSSVKDPFSNPFGSDAFGS